MSIFKIISKDSQAIRYEGAPQYNGAYLGVDYIEFRSISSPFIINWEIGDYVDYFRTGKRYKLYSLPMPKKVARVGSYGGAIEYSNVQFFAATKELEIAPFKDLVADDNGIHFSTRPDVSTFEDVSGIARRIEACMNDIFPNRWKINVYESDDEDLSALLSEKKEFSVSQGSCLDALSQIYDTWKGVGWIHTTDAQSGREIITIGRANVRDAGNTTNLFKYGVGNGLTSIKKATANEGEFATRLYVYGSNRNLPARYYNQFDIVNAESADIQNLMIPLGEWGLTDGIPDPSKAYLQADDALIEKYGLIPKTIYFDGSNHEEIYPSIKGLTRLQVREAMIEAGDGGSEYLPSKISGADNYRIDEVGLVNYNDLDEGTREDYEKSPNINICLREMGFNLADQGKLTSEGYAVISMVSGPCQGREFRVRKYVGVAVGNPLYGERDYNIEKVWDDSLGMSFPNRIFPINTGDQFVLLDIPMPDFYVTINSQKLLEKGRQMLADYTRVSAFYEPGVNAIRMKDVGGVITPGMFMQISDKDIIDTKDHKDYVLIDSVSIDENAEIPTYRITLREQKRAARTYSALEEMIEDAKEDANQAIKRERQYTDRRFRSSQETLQMLESAFTNFSKGITPATVKTMALLIGDESLQYKFTASRDSLVDVPCPLSWSAETRQMIGVPASLIHMTLGVEGIVPSGTRVASDYKSWNVVSWWDKETFESEFLEDAEKSYYVYVKASKDSADAWYFLDEESHSMIEDDAYYFLVGILNSEYDGNRDFVTLYGFTEVLPGQITTDVIRSADGQTYFDLIRGVIGGRIVFKSNRGGEKSIVDLEDEIQDQIDGVVENWNGEGTPTLTNEPAVNWLTDAEKIAHINDTYINIEEYVDDETTPPAGQAWRWCRCTNESIADFVTVTAKDGETFNLHWHPIADSDAVRALKELSTKADKSNLEVLTKNLKDGSTIVDGGLVMTSLVAVGSANESNIEAFLNGSGKFLDVEHGKMILAGGIPSGEEDIEERTKKAATIIYEDGTINTSKIIAKEGELSGFKFDRDYLSANIAVDDESGNVKTQQTKISPYEISINGTEKQAGSEGYKTQVALYPMIAGMIPTATAGIIRHELVDAVPDDMFGYITSCATLILSAKGALPINSRGFGGNYSILSENGMFAGLRPRTFKHPDQTYTYLSTLDHTIISVFGDGNRWLYLPTNPENGQHYRIVKYGSHLLHVDSQESERLVTRIGVSEEIGHAFENAWVGTIEVTYCSEIERWVMTAVTSY